MELPRYVSELECHPHRMVTLERLADFTLRGREEEKIGTPVFGLNRFRFDRDHDGAGKIGIR